MSPLFLQFEKGDECTLGIGAHGKTPTITLACRESTGQHREAAIHLSADEARKLAKELLARADAHDEAHPTPDPA